MVTFSAESPGTRAEEWTAHPRATTVKQFGLDPEETDHVVVVAAHPDDETLGAGGLLSMATRSGIRVTVVVATDGEASHPGSPTHTAEQLARLRRTELQHAVKLLAPGATITMLGHPDGGLTAYEEELVVTLVGVIGDGRRTLLAAPWRHDGHPDHEAAGRAAATTASRTGARLAEYPIWLWHWAEPEDAPWDRFRALDLDDADVTAKTQAQAAHRTQVEPLSDQAGDEVLLSKEFLRHFDATREIYVAEPPSDLALDDLHASDDDPWGTASRWYERRKRALLLAALPRETFRHGLEVGGSSGALAAGLATRCGELLVAESSSHAVAAARRRLASSDHVRVERRAVPGEWPEPPPAGFDLIVLSEVGYFLSPRDLDEVIEQIRTTLSPDGVLVLCHWRHDVVGWPLDGPSVHATVAAAGVRPVVARYHDRDFELLVLATADDLPEPEDDS